MIYVNSVRIYPETITLETGCWYYQAYAEVCPENADCKEVTWYSDDPAIASVNYSSGYIYARSVGVTRIHAMATDGSGCCDYLTVTVKKSVPVRSVTLDHSYLSLEKGTDVTLHATVCPENATNRRLNWHSNNPNVATVSNGGTVTAISKGSTIITATAADGSLACDCCNVTVTTDILVSSVTIVPSSKTMPVGTSAFLDAILCPTNAAKPYVSWSSANESIATVNPSSGLVYAKSPGTVVIYATAIDGGGACGCCAVTVHTIPVTSVTISQESLSLIIGESVCLEATVLPADATVKNVCWTSENCNIADVDENGCVIAKAPGTTHICATAQDGSGLCDCCLVTVRTIPVTSVIVSPESLSLNIGESACLEATVLPENATTKAILWTSGNSEIAEVDASGRVTAKAAGTTSVCATAQDGNGVSGYCSVTVHTVPVTSVTVSPESLSLNIGETACLEATVLPENATTKAILWTSGNSEIVEVDANGRITAKAAGTTSVCATAQDGNGVSGCCTVTVTIIPTVKGLKTIARCRVRKEMSMDDSAILKDSSNSNVVLAINDMVPLLSNNKISYNSRLWYRILYKGMMMHVTADDDSFEETDVPAPPTPPSGTDILVLSDSRVLNLRCSPDIGSMLIGTFRAGTPLILTNAKPQNSKWYAVYGQTSDGSYSYGWCSGDFIGSYQEFGTLVDPDYLTVRTGPGFSYESPGKIYKGETVRILEKNCATGSGYTWHKILYNNSVRYVVAGNTTPCFEFETKFVSLTNIVYGDLPSTETIIQNLQNCPTSVIPSKDKPTCVAVASHMLRQGYEVAFVAGMLGNIIAEGTIGQFEISNYKTHPEAKPDYLVYMDTNYNGTNFYLNNYSGKNITEVNVIAVWNMLQDLNNQSNGTWKIGNSHVGFGLGCFQWTFDRTYTLGELYVSKLTPGSSSITQAQAIEAEATMITNEMNSSKHRPALEKWREEYPINWSCGAAANRAGALICLKYVMPYNMENKAPLRGAKAEAIFGEMIKS